MNLFVRLKRAHFSQLDNKIIAYRDDIVRVVANIVEENQFEVTDFGGYVYFRVNKDTGIREVIDPKKLDLNTMTEEEIEFYIWSGRSTVEGVSLRDVYTDEQISMLTSHPQWNKFSVGFCRFVHAAIDAMYLEMENQK